MWVDFEEVVYQLPGNNDKSWWLPPKKRSLGKRFTRKLLVEGRLVKERKMHPLVPWLLPLIAGTALVSSYINSVVPDPYLVCSSSPIFVVVRKADETREGS